MNKNKVHKQCYSEHSFLNCQKTFQSYANTNRKYCSYSCYINSRFGHNIVDSLTTVRKLKEGGVEIYFEKENIWTLDSKGE